MNEYRAPCHDDYLPPVSSAESEHMLRLPDIDFRLNPLRSSIFKVIRGKLDIRSPYIKLDGARPNIWRMPGIWNIFYLIEFLYCGEIFIIWQNILENAGYPALDTR